MTETFFGKFMVSSLCVYFMFNAGIMVVYLRIWY